MTALRLTGGRLACVPEAPLEDSGAGLAPTGEGWFVVNVRDTKWAVTAEYGSGCGFESREFRFEQLGFNICALEPGEPNCLYHSESQQEAFLVLSGECRLLVEGEARLLRAWDFFHCPPGTEHVFEGAGSGPCVIFMVGARTPDKRIVYPDSEPARSHGAGVEMGTSSPKEAYSGFPHWTPGRPSRRAKI